VAGGLIGYGTNTTDLTVRPASTSAIFSRASSLPIKFDVVINQRLFGLCKKVVSRAQFGAAVSSAKIPVPGIGSRCPGFRPSDDSAIFGAARSSQRRPISLLAARAPSAALVNFDPEKMQNPFRGRQSHSIWKLVIAAKS
jgi:hypothetical protein